MPAAPAAACPADSAETLAAVCRAIDDAGGWLRFDDFLAIAQHHPRYGYYGSGRARFGAGGDFYTAPLVSPLFGDTLARLTAPLLADGGGDILELGAGDGALAAQLLTQLPPGCSRRYLILEPSAPLAAAQRQRLAGFDGVRWLSALPARHRGVIIANEVLDCAPFRLLQRQDARWRERGVTHTHHQLAFALRDLSDDAAAPLQGRAFAEGYQTEVSPQAAALAASLAACLQEGWLLFADYGYGRDEYYHPQRARGTMTCYCRLLADDDPLAQPGEKDITAHVDFTAVAEAGIAAGARLAGYVTQAQGLINSGLLAGLAAAGAPGSAAYTRAAAAAHRLLAPHEMGEIIKWMGFVRGDAPPPPAFAAGDLRHRL